MMLGRVSRGVTAFAIVGASTFAVIYDSGPAQADTIVQEAELLLKGAAGGGVGIAAASPEVIAAEGAVCATGVGCALLGVAAAGIVLYATKDTWVPFVRNAFGGGTNSDTPGNGTVYPMMFSLVGDPTAPNYAVVLDYVAGGAACGNGCGDWHSAVSSTLVCKAPDGTTSTTVINGATTGFLNRATSGRLSLIQPSGGPPVGCGSSDWTNNSGPAGSTVLSLTLAFEASQSHELSNRVVIGAPASSIYTQARVNCTNPDGSSYEVVGATQSVNGDVLMPSCVGAAGLAAGGQTGAHGNCVTLSAATAAALGPFMDQSSNCGAAALSVAKYPNCVGNSACTYVIRVNGVPCSVGAPGCADWPARAELSPENYQCWYGPYQISLAGCNLLERAYEPQTAPLTASVANTDGDPRTHSGPAPAINPPTSPRVPASSTPPATDPNAPKPCTSGQACDVSPVPPSGNDCFPSGFGAFNPVSWVQQPIQCALSWSFVPSTAVMTDVQTTATNDFTSQGFGPVLTALAVDVGKVGGGSGCDGPPVTFSAVGVVKPMHPFSACAEPMATLASISYAVTTVVVVLGGGWALLVAVGAGFGFNVKRGGGVQS